MMSERPPGRDPHTSLSWSVTAAVRSHAGPPPGMKNSSPQSPTVLAGDATQLTVLSGNFSLPERACLALDRAPFLGAVRVQRRVDDGEGRLPTLTQDKAEEASGIQKLCGLVAAFIRVPARLLPSPFPAPFRKAFPRNPPCAHLAPESDSQEAPSVAWSWDCPLAGPAREGPCSPPAVRHGRETTVLSRHLPSGGVDPGWVRGSRRLAPSTRLFPGCVYVKRHACE